MRPRAASSAERCHLLFGGPLGAPFPSLPDFAGGVFSRGFRSTVTCNGWPLSGTVTTARPMNDERRIPPLCISSSTQPLDLKFTGGSDSAVAGEYRVRSVELLAEGEGPGGRRLSGSFAGREMIAKVTVREGQTTRLEAGLPLRVEPQVAVDEDRTLRISLRITGAPQSHITWNPFMSARGRSLSRAWIGANVRRIFW